MCLLSPLPDLCFCKQRVIPKELRYSTCTTVYCTVLYCTILYSTVLYCTVLYCIILYYTVLYCTVLYCILYYTVLYCTVLYCTVLYCTILYCTVLYCTILYCTVWCCIVKLICKHYIFCYIRTNVKKITYNNMFSETERWVSVVLYNSSVRILSCVYTYIHTLYISLYM